MRFWSVLVLLVVGYFIRDVISDLPGAQEVWVYPLECKGKVADNRCIGTLGEPMPPFSFVAFPDRQEVVKHSGGIVTRLEGCAVFDWRTWNCISENEAGTRIQMMDRGAFAVYFEPRGGGITMSEQLRVYMSAWLYYPLKWLY